MKIVTRTYSRVSRDNGQNGCTLARSGKGIDPVNPRPASSNGVYDREKSGSVVTSARCSFGNSEGARREFLPMAAGRSEAASGLPGRAASDNEVIFFYCIKGRGWCEIGGQRYEIMPGQLLAMPANSERSYATYGERSWSLIWIQLAEVNNSASASKPNLDPRTTSLGPYEKREMLALFQEVMQALEMPCAQRLEQVSQRTMGLLHSIISSQRESCQTETDAAGRIGRTIEYMKEHLNESLRAATLAAVANMSLPHYFAQFKRVIGSSPIDYLIKLRMEHARRLLSETSWSVKEVAVSLGYDDPLYFSRVFKSINHTAPSDFRVRKRNVAGG
jgi:AraC family transcriptional regulator, arabinose operon regulatory protein